MTNKEFLEKADAKTRYAINYSIKMHPLNEYIDWDSYFNSEDTNEMHFINCLRFPNGEPVYIEDELALEITYLDEDEFHTEYLRCYNFETEIFNIVPMPISLMFKLNMLNTKE